MSKKKNKHQFGMAASDNGSEKSLEQTVTLSEGASLIDIGELRRAQAEHYASDEELAEHELSLDEEAAALRAEIDSDPEMKIDVLSGFDAEDSDGDLDHLAAKIQVQTDEQLAQFQHLASEVSDELKDLNQELINEDKLLESEIAKELMAESAKPSKKSKKAAAAAASALASDSLETSGLDGNEEEAVEVEEMSEEDAELKAALPHADENGNYALDDLQSCIEALLFYSDRPVSLKKLKEMLEMTEAEDAPMLQAIEGLKEQFASSIHGFEIAEIANGYQLRTKASKAPLLRKLAKIQIQRLSRGAMETLTIVSYKQPCTKDDIDKVRGVDSSHFIRTLLDRKLIEVNGRSEAAGRPMIYATTDTFLEVFGLMNLQGLPPLREIEAMVPQMAAAEEGAEDPRVIQMRKLVHQMKEDSNHLDYNAKEDEQILQEIRERVKSIDISTPYLERQKELAAQGITGADAEEILTQEFNFANKSSGGEVIVEETEMSLTEELMSESSLNESTETSVDHANNEHAEHDHRASSDANDSESHE